MKKFCLALAILVLAAILSVGLILEKSLTADPAQAAQVSQKESPAASRAEPEPRAVPVSEIPLVFQVFVGLICGFFVLLGVVPIFLIDSDNRTA